MATTDEPVDRPPFWSPWGDRLIATLSVGFAFCLTWWWIAISYLDLPLSTYLVWKPNDRPSPLPPVSEAVLGVHYFSDFQEGHFWGQEILHGISPYDLPNLYPPLSAWVMVPFAALPVGLGLTLFLVFTGLTFVVPCWLLLRGLRVPTRIMVTSFVALLTGPFLALVDRGNLHGLTLGAVGFGLVALQRRRVRWAVVLFAVAICLKPTFLIIVVVALARRRVRFAINTALVALLGTLVAAILLPEGPINVYGMLKRQFEAAGGPDLSFLERILNNVSGTGLVANIEVLLHGMQPDGLLIEHVPALTLITAIIGVAIAFVVAWRRNLPQWVWVAVGLSMTQLAQPFSGIHTSAWVAYAAIFFGAGAVLPAEAVGADAERHDRWIQALRILVLLATAVTLLPLALRPTIGGVDVPVQHILAPLLWVTVCLVSVGASLIRPSARETDATVT